MYIKSNFIPVELYTKYTINNSKFYNKPISIFNDYTPTIEELKINPYNILVIQEPNQLFGLHDWAIQNHKHFSCILTWGQQILDNCDNALLLPFGTTFLHGKNKYKELSNTDKNFEISFLCGPKKQIDGHLLRHIIFDKREKIKIPNYLVFSCPSEEKYKCFENKMFHLAIENSVNQNYFTEKIVDAFITKTIPIYRGCPNISEFFDERGFFTFNTEDEFFDIVNSLTENDYYSRKEYIDKNYELAIYWAEYFMRFNKIIEEIITLNSI